jgi:hypothetical protein
MQTFDAVPGITQLPSPAASNRQVRQHSHTTDGHLFSLSLKRANLHILSAIGAIIIDSSAAKQLSDALSRTIPVLLATVNACLFDDYDTIPLSHVNIRSYRELMLDSGLLTSKIREGLTRPFKAYYIYPGSDNLDVDERYTPIYLVNASGESLNESAVLPQLKHFKVCCVLLINSMSEEQETMKRLGVWV